MDSGNFILELKPQSRISRHVRINHRRPGCPSSCRPSLENKTHQTHGEESENHLPNGEIRSFGFFAAEGEKHLAAEGVRGRWLKEKSWEESSQASGRGPFARAQHIEGQDLPPEIRCRANIDT